MSIGFLILKPGNNLNRDAADIVHTFSAMGDSTRLTILTRLMQGELPLLALASPLEMSLTAVSKHVSVLQKAGLVAVEKRGRTRYCRIRMERFTEAATWMHDCERFWAQNLDQLAVHLDDPQNDT